MGTVTGRTSTPFCLASVSFNPTRPEFGIDEGTIRDQPIASRPLASSKVVAHDAEVVEGHVGKLGAAGTLAHRPHSGCAGLQTFIDPNVAALIKLYSRAVEPDALRVRLTAGGHEHVAALEHPLARDRPEIECQSASNFDP
jgi:hypothetical protein